MKELNEIILNKIQRQTLLREKSRQLEELDIDLSGSRFTRWFGSSYLRIKRFLLLLIAIVLILFSLLLIIDPSVFYESPEIKEAVIQDSREYYQEMFGQTMSNALIDIISSDSSPRDITKTLSDSFDKVALKEFSDSLQVFGFLLIILAFIMIYIGRLTKKMRIRNSKISDSQTITQEVIMMFTEAIQEEENELVMMQELLKDKPDSSAKAGDNDRNKSNSSE